MDCKKITPTVLNALILVIGLYMTISYVKVALPPTLSGIAFIFIAAIGFIPKD